MAGLSLAIAAAFAAGFSQVGSKLLEKGLVEPALKPALDQISHYVGKGYKKAEAQKAVQDAVSQAFVTIEAPTGDALDDFIFNRGFAVLQAEDNHLLREEVARAALLQTSPDPQLVPDRLFKNLGLSHENRPLLGGFLYAVRANLAGNTYWGPLINQADTAATRAYLYQIAQASERTAQATERFDANLQALVNHFGLHTNYSDAQAMQSYLNYVSTTYRDLAFVLTKARRRERLADKAELEAVFVPLQVQDPTQNQLKTSSRRSIWRQMDEERGQATTLTISQVVNRFPFFVLKGKPGSGKTTLLRHLALSFARGEAATKLEWSGQPLFPILLPLRNFGRFLDNQPMLNPGPLALLQFMSHYFADQLLKLPPHFFSDRLDQGQCLIMLDGLDEVADYDDRARVAQFAHKFIAHYQPLGNHFVLASRPRGYEQVQDYFNNPAVCDVLDMTPAERDKLVLNLLQELETDTRQQYKDLQILLNDMRLKGQVDELSRNPLFCTTLVLVYKYQGTTLPDRRVDVYQELVNLMLGYWDTSRAGREGTAEVSELALKDGTGRPFLEQKDAVEAKERALMFIAGWLQDAEPPQLEVPRTEAIEALADYFHREEGAAAPEKKNWARNFLDVAHQRSGLFVEIAPDVYAFSHKHFLEYLVALELINELDQAMLDKILAHAGQDWWEEVIRLALAHEKLPAQRLPLILPKLVEAGHLILAGWSAVDAGARLRPPQRESLKQQLYAHTTNGAVPSQERHRVGEVLDALGWLPPDLNQWVRCPVCADDKNDLLAMKYPVTNSQFERFIDAGSYDNPVYWGGEKNPAWQWRMAGERPYPAGKDTTEPAYWQDTRFGKERHGYPVVGISWFEAWAYANWLTGLLQRANAGESLDELEQIATVELVKAQVSQVRLPTETEWVRLAGGDAADRYPWDKPGMPVTTDVAEIIRRANVSEGEIGKTSPVGMYPQGASEPFKLMDMAGNVWEWTNSWWDEKQGRRVVRGGSWYNNPRSARVGLRGRYNPDNSDYRIGFRLVSPIGSGS